MKLLSILDKQVTGSRAEPVRRSTPRHGRAAFARVGAILGHEHLALGRCNFAKETGRRGIAQLDGLRLEPVLKSS